MQALCIYNKYIECYSVTALFNNSVILQREGRSGGPDFHPRNPHAGLRLYAGPVADLTPPVAQQIPVGRFRRRQGTNKIR